MKELLFNGKFLAQKLTGVQRYSLRHTAQNIVDTVFGE